MTVMVYEGYDLSLESIYNRAPKDYRWAYDWLMQNAGTVGPRPYGTAAPENAPIKLSSQSGIHKPGKYPYALTVTSAGASMYAADDLIDLDDGTWILRYCAHRQNEGSLNSGSSKYNTSLIRCLQDGLPVGVFKKTPAGNYEHLGLALLDHFDTDTQMFCLHGPLTLTQSPELFSVLTHEKASSLQHTGFLGGIDFKTLIDFSWDENLAGTEMDSGGTLQLATHAEERVLLARQRQVFHQELLDAYDGRCALTGLAAAPAVRPAHICTYLGLASQTPANGLPLRADLQALWAASLISIDPETMKLDVAPLESLADYQALAGMELRLPANRKLRPNPKRLQAHRQAFLDICRTA